MTAEVTAAVARAFDHARRAAAADGAAAVAPRHLLAGLVADADGRPHTWLAEHGFSPAVVAELPAGQQLMDLPWASATVEALSVAQRLARSDTADHIVNSDHVLLGLLRTDAELLNSLTTGGLRFDAMEEQYATAHAAPLALHAPLEFADPIEQCNTARILDANANRAREAIRVLEDFVRFSLDDAFLSRQLKQLRHDLSQALAVFPPNTLLAARDTRGDVGTDISTSAEQVRHSSADVVQANIKRLQEAMRVLEEYGKLVAPELGQRLEAIRYRSYTLEQVLLLGCQSRTRLSAAKLYVLLTASKCRAALDWTIAEAAAGGADIIQLREKDLPDRELLTRACDVRRWSRKAGLLFIVNDRPDIARLADADGVHLGQEDIPLRDARRILGPDKLIGVSTHTVEQVRQAVLDGASYIGVGPTFSSATKDFARLAGLDFVRAAVAETSLPAFVLGGVTSDNVSEVVAAGGRRIAVSAAVALAHDPRAVVRQLRMSLD